MRSFPQKGSPPICALLNDSLMRLNGLEPPVSEADLHAFADGGLSRRRQEAVGAFLAASPADAARVALWQRQNEMIRAAFASIKTAPQPFSSSSAPATSMIAAAGGEAGSACRGRPSWRERWFAYAVLIAFVSGALLAAAAGNFAGRLESADTTPGFAGEPGLAEFQANELFAARTLSALLAFDLPPAGTPGLSQKEPWHDLAVPVLPSLPAEGLRLAAVRPIPGEQGQMLCMFYTKQDAGNLALCAEKTPGPPETAARLSGSFPLGRISWRQGGVSYAIAGALLEPELRDLADVVRAQAADFADKRTGDIHEPPAPLFRAPN